MAKLAIAAGGVSVNGALETRRGRKLRVGDEVTVSDSVIRVVAAAAI